MVTKLITLSAIAEVRAQVCAWKKSALRVALVPTMGNLHDGHLSLVQLARTHADKVVASVFVNPTQFGPNEDFASYPRTLATDQVLLESGGCDLLFAPSAEEMYKAKPSLNIDVGPIGTILCGAVRPGHFNGVATVVAKLLNIVQPDVAVFGEKDFQQLMVIRQLVQQLDFPVEIIAAPTVREPNGLARSSRNQYLTSDERQLASVIYATLLQMRDSIRAGKAIKDVETSASQALLKAGLKPDYAVVRNAQDLEIVEKNVKSEVALIAARLGKARLIDNLSWLC
jgi:pantoate--beta-alanine ligase